MISLTITKYKHEWKLRINYVGSHTECVGPSVPKLLQQAIEWLEADEAHTHNREAS